MACPKVSEIGGCWDGWKGMACFFIPFSCKMLESGKNNLLLDLAISMQMLQTGIVPNRKDVFL